MTSKSETALWILLGLLVLNILGIFGSLQFGKLELLFGLGFIGFPLIFIAFIIAAITWHWGKRK